MRDDFLETIMRPELGGRRDPAISGVLIARVTGRMDNGTYELAYNGMGQNAPSAPARMMMPNTGGGRGIHFMPEEGDTVVVAFTGGDPNSPVILGGLWNGAAPPPDQAQPSAENNIRTIVSRSGHEITFDDTTAAGKVKIRTAGGREALLDDTPPGKITVKNPVGVELEINDAPPEVKITAPAMITLETAALNLLAGQVSMGPATSVPAPPMPTEINAPVQFKVTSALIQLNAAAITIQGGAMTINASAIAITTTGLKATSTVVIDGFPWSLA